MPYSLIIDFVLALLAILVTLYIYLTWNFNYWSKRGLRTANPTTIFGSFPSIITGKRNMVYDIHDIYLKYKDSNRAVGVFMTRKPEILVLDPELAQSILVTNFQHFRDSITSSWINNAKEDKYAVRNPFWCTGEDWKVRRMDVLAGLTQSKLKQSYPIWESSCQRLMKYLHEKTFANYAVIETRDLINRYAADVMCDFIWGIDPGTLTRPNEPSTIMQMTDKWLNHTYKTRVYSIIATIAPVVRVIWPFCLFPKDTDNFFSKLTLDAIKLRLTTGAVDRADFLNYLLQCKALSHDDFVGHSLTVLLDGYETVAIALMHTLFFMAKYPLVQKKLRAEICSNKNKNEEFLTIETLVNMPYLDQCVHETLRLISLLPIIPRICTTSTTLRLSHEKQIEIPKGMVVTIPIYSFHHDENYFPQSNTYCPERFDGSAHVKLTKQGIFLPFGNGPRICAGIRLALLTIKVALVEILSEYEICNCELTQHESNPNVTSFVLGLEGNIMLEYKRL